MVPSADVVGLDLADVFVDFGCRGPVNPADKGLTVASAGKAMLPRLFGLSLEKLLNLPPWLVKINVGFSHEGSLIPAPFIKALSVPPPFFEIGQCRGHGPFDVVPMVLLLPELRLQVHPCPFNMG